MTIQQAIEILENAQKLLQPVVENWDDISSNEDVREEIEEVINQLNISAEVLTEEIEMEDTAYLRQENRGDNF